ncbi:P-loop containing nucleoside triphosphate hydrolase [Phytophthora cactorum]|nr:P-loop containing nucleoside triphosphate hydrolase [Phytophthora cactorum]
MASDEAKPVLTKEEKAAKKAAKLAKKLAKEQAKAEAEGSDSSRSREADEENDDTDPAEETGESEVEAPATKKAKSENATHVGGEENPPLDSFRICDETKKNLQTRGIHTLSPFRQASARAWPCSSCGVHGPTRELAKQVASEFELTGPSLSTVCIYGGASYQSQNNAFRSGVDILVGTTGRVIDHIDRGNLRLHNCEFLILDEADTMLEMGFREDVQKVFTAMDQVKNESTGKRQTLLFSATIPKWVKDVADKYMKKAEYVNLVKDSDDQASTDVQHIAIPCHWQGRPTLLANLLGVYAKKDSRTIIFAETKKDCNELAVHPEIKTDCQVLHGDIAQEQRETTMKAFREGRLRLLIATDVAARGLDMNVDLVINSEPPRKMSGMADVDTYVHRSGRTGRAGKKGICITLYTNRQRDQLNQIERKIGNKFIMKGPPAQEDLIKASAAKALKEIDNVDPAMVEIFQEKARELLETMEPEKCLAAALACITGHTKPPRRTSLMSGVPDYVTVLFTSSNFIRAKGYVWNALNRDIPEDTAKDIKQLTLTEDSMGACFDLPIAGLELLEKHIEEGGMNCPYSIPKTVPKLQQSAYQMRQQSYGGRGGGRGAGRGFGGGRGGRGRGGGGRGRRY